jgi:flagellar basal body rod protein FlgC
LTVVIFNTNLGPTNVEIEESQEVEAETVAETTEDTTVGQDPDHPETTEEVVVAAAEADQVEEKTADLET